MRVFPIFQDNGRSLAEYTWSKGYAHGQWAHDQAVHFGFNRGTLIYFAVDYDATVADMPKIIQYFRGVSSALSSKGKRYLFGVYGSRNVCAQVTKETYATYSFVPGMSWGFSGNLGFPLPENWSFNQIKEYQVTNGSDTFALDNDVRRPKSDIGQNSVNRPVSPAAEFIANIDKLYGLAQSYGKGDPNRLVTDYYRQMAYAGVQWQALIAGVDWAFIDYANSNGAELLSTLNDPFTSLTVGPQHLLATAAGQLIKPAPSDRHTANGGDVAGWASDLMTFYGEWRRDSDSYASGYTYCTERMAKIGVESSFAIGDLIEDADGFLLAEKMRNKTPINKAVRDHYEGSGGATRFQDYVAQRFGSSATTAADAAFNILTTTADTIISTGRAYLTLTTAKEGVILPHDLPPTMLRDYCKGFGDSLMARAGLEARSQAKYLANHARAFSKESWVGSWVIAVTFVGVGSSCLRIRQGKRLRGAVVAGLVTALLCYLLGAVEVSFADPSRMCEPTVSIPTWYRYEEAFLPPRAACPWADGRTYDLVSPWVNPLLFIALGVSAVCLKVLMASLKRKRSQR
ncbi:glycoside hydrolase domain-containing protein [Streptomyces griseoluteus]|uniref:glycoside hydrolase domain-containing protein n=1 Tax=Streptomyces griseoluteus TaxID=29306 RepID=UPI00332325CF